eukprot:TRINITY_DN2821_c0_g1_i1.p1 TRINITY_DN2821_c0_g1~~TRINITY_DN2821_c0_g1_i1.p1  ORF type:complete len:213 (+),score=32.94 TRINITY_DN2821_c0_g1_i1:58-696(+)
MVFAASICAKLIVIASLVMDACSAAMVILAGLGAASAMPVYIFTPSVPYIMPAIPWTETAAGIAAAAGAGTAATAGATTAASAAAAAETFAAAGAAATLSVPPLAVSPLLGPATYIVMQRPKKALLALGLIVGAEANSSTVTWDCWKPILHEKSTAPSRGRLLADILNDPAIDDYSVGRGSVFVRNRWNESWRLDPVVLPWGQVAAHASKIM